MDDTTDRDERGRLVSEHGVSAADVLAAIDPGETVTSSDVREEFQIPYRTAKHHLDRLVERGELESRKPNPRLTLYQRDD